MLEHGYLKIMPAGVTAGIQVLTQPLRNDDVDYNGLLFRRDTILRRPAQPAAYLPSVAGVTKVIMNIRPNLRMSKAAFIEWDAGEGQRCELVGGRVVMMPRPSLAHGMIIANLMVLLRARLDPKDWVVIAEFGLDTGPETLRYPDIVVDRAGRPGKSYTAGAPAFLAEVLSPSTAEIDLGDKAAEYLRVPSLHAYIVLSQDEPKAWVFERTGAQFASGPAVVSGADAAIRIAALQLELPMAEIYAGIKTG